jgi:CBS domain containing-hemolysin-like protein
MVGVVHLIDLVRADGDEVGDHARPVVMLPEALGLLPALRRLQSDRRQWRW